MWLSPVKYWKYRGLSKPSSWWTCATACGLRSSPRMIRAGSPGFRWMSMKTPTVTRNATGTISTRRRRTYVVMPDQVSGMTFPRTIGESLALPDLRHPDHQVWIEREVVDLGVGDLR